MNRRFFYLASTMRSINLLKKHSVFLLILLAATCLRFIPLFQYQFTYDEISALQRVGYSDLFTLIEKGVKIDAHPALLQVLIWLITRVCGYSTWVIKLPFLLMSLGAIIYAYSLAYRNFSRNAALSAALLFSFALVFVYYAPIARMYGSGVFFTLGLLFHFFELVFRSNYKPRHYVWFTVFLLLCAYNHHINALFAATLYLSGIVLISRHQLKNYIVTGLLALLFYAPHLPVTFYQLGVGGIGVEQGGWLEAPRPVVFLETINVFCGSGYGLAIILILMLTAVIKQRADGERRKKELLLVLLYLMNFVIVFGYSIVRAPVYQHSVMIFAGCGLVILFSSLLDAKSRHTGYAILFVLAVALLSQTYYQKAYYKNCISTVYEYQFERTLHYKDEFGGATVYPLYFDADTVMRRIYFDKYRTDFACKLSSDPVLNQDPHVNFQIGGKEVSALKLFSGFISSLKEDVVVLGSAPPLHQAIVRDHFPLLVENTQTQGVHLKVYARNKEVKTVKEDSVLVVASLQSTAGAAAGTVAVAEDIEFPPGLKLNYRAAVKNEGQVILAKAVVESELPLTGLECVISVTDSVSGTTIHYTAMAAKDFLFSENGVTTIYVQMFAGNFHHQTDRHSRVNIYLWNKDREQFLLRDLTTKVIDHWPEKWQFWD